MCTCLVLFVSAFHVMQLCSLSVWIMDGNVLRPRQIHLWIHFKVRTKKKKSRIRLHKSMLISNTNNINFYKRSTTSCLQWILNDWKFRVRKFVLIWIANQHVPTKICVIVKMFNCIVYCLWTSSLMASPKYIYIALSNWPLRRTSRKYFPSV